MGRRGPKKKPTALEKAGGYPGKKRKNKREPKYRDPAKKPPDWLTDKNAIAKWRETYAMLTKARVLTEADRDALGLYCWTFGEFLIAAAFLKEWGSVMALKDKGGKVRYLQTYPQATLARQHLATMHRLQCEFGLTPSSRAGIGTDGYSPTGTGQPGTEFEDFRSLIFTNGPPSATSIIGKRPDGGMGEVDSDGE